MELDHVLIKGAREHNLRSVDVRIPKKKLVVLTGVSGSGKSSLAFDTLYAEGQRRYVESLSAYARQFLGQMEKPRYDTIRGQGTQEPCVDAMQTREELYDILGYHEAERALDALFSTQRRSAKDTGRET